jgi:hypothetical protein
MQMTSKEIHAAIVLFVWALCAPVFSANPSLDAYRQGINDPLKHSKALTLAELALDLDVAGTLADGTLTARFYNPSADLLEGRFAFELPAGAVVTGYSLDINGTLVDGVLVEPLKARRSYEAQVRRGIDPGLAEVSRANVFSTQVYPLMPKGSRTIRVRFSSPMDAARGLVIPLATAREVGKFTLNLRAGAGSRPPDVVVPRLPGKLVWSETSEGFSASMSAERHVLDGELRITPADKTADHIVSRHPNGRRFFQVVGEGRGVPRDIHGARLRIYWDRSLSRRDDRLADERALVTQLVAQMQPSAIDLVSFNSSGARVRRVNPAGLDDALRGILYRGATSYRVLDSLDVPGADICLVFSDGVVTLDPRPDFRPGCEVLAITSAPDADLGFLGRLTRHEGGEVLRLGSMNVNEILARMSRRTVHVLDARSDNGSTLDFAMLPAGNAGWMVVGEAREARTVVLRIAGLGHDVVERRYSLADRPPVKFSGAGALWAAARASALAAEDGGHEALVVLSRQFSVAGPSLSFLVLENPRDYIEADIAPPANYPKESLAEYRRIKADYDESQRANGAGRLERVIAQWTEQREWWSTKFERQAPRKIAPGNDRLRRIDDGLAMSPAPPAPMLESVASADAMSSPVIVTGVRASMQSGMSANRLASGPSISVKLEEWGPDRPYLKALDAARPAEIDRVLAREETRYGALPAFYFDVAEWLYRRKRGVEALEMLLSALDLPVANEETVAMVADRMLRYGRTDRAIWLYERALAQSDDLPQPRRSLALALARRAESATTAAARRDLSRALQLLNEIIVRTWDGSYDGIELIALMEANRLLPRLQVFRPKEIPLDPRLRALLDVDIRVTIEWNTGATDMDLWVDEPSGERAIYSNPRTQIGGRLSNDMTSGYGPEEYLLRHAIPGEYRISANVYSTDRINPNGTTVVTAHLIRNFGRPNQSEETMEIELEPDASGEQRIGRFTVQ